MSTSQVDRPLVSDKHTYELAPILGEQWQMSWTFTTMIGCFALLFLLLNHTPLALQSTWQHVNSGSRFVSQDMSLVGFDAGANYTAQVPLADGMPSVAESWLFDSGVFFLADQLGSQSLSAVIALLASAVIWLWCGIIYRVCGSIRYTLLVAIALAITWFADSTHLQSRLIGMVLFGLTMMTVYQPSLFANDERNETTHSAFATWQWLAAAGLFALWANVDGSFWIGIAALLSIAIGVAYGQVRQFGFREAVASQQTQQWFLFVNLSTLATLANPQHIGLWQFGVTEKIDIFLTGVTRGHGLYLPTVMGLTVLALLGYLIWEIKRSQKTVQPAAIAVLTTMVVLTILAASNVYWLIPVVLLVASTLRDRPAAEATKSEANENQEEEKEERSLRFAGSLCCVLLIWFAFALSTAGTAVLGGKPRAANRIYQSNVPVAVSGFLSDRNPVAPADFGWATSERPLIWAPADWSEWLLWDTPEGTRLFTDSQLDRLPPRVQADYAKIYRGDTDWNRLLDRYAVGTLVIDKHRQPKLASEAIRHSSWKLVLETHGAMALQRIPIARADKQRGES